jgi:hypothetical protein
MLQGTFPFSWTSSLLLRQSVHLYHHKTTSKQRMVIHNKSGVSKGTATFVSFLACEDPDKGQESFVIQVKAVSQDKLYSALDGDGCLRVAFSEFQEGGGKFQPGAVDELLVLWRGRGWCVTCYLKCRIWFC